MKLDLHNQSFFIATTRARSWCSFANVTERNINRQLVSLTKYLCQLAFLVIPLAPLATMWALASRSADASTESSVGAGWGTWNLLSSTFTGRSRIRVAVLIRKASGRACCAPLQERMRGSWGVLKAAIAGRQDSTMRLHTMIVCSGRSPWLRVIVRSVCGVWDERASGVGVVDAVVE